MVCYESAPKMMSRSQKLGFMGQSDAFLAGLILYFCIRSSPDYNSGTVQSQTRESQRVFFPQENSKRYENWLVQWPEMGERPPKPTF